MNYVVNYIKRKWHNFIHTIYSSYMCIKYPFLYPRNRFTGLHYNNWKIIEYHRNNYKKAVLSYSIAFDDNILSYALYNTVDHVTVNDKDLMAKYDVISRKLNLTYNSKIISSIDLREYFVKEMPQDFKIFMTCGKNSNHVTIKLFRVLSNNSNNITNYADRIQYKEDACHFFDAVINKPLYWKIQILDWIHDYPLQWIHCIPSHNEYDALETGWKIAFGKQLLDELKAELKRVNFLYKYRIFDIKEKYGHLQWDSAAVPADSNIYDITRKYENLSYDYCIYCGKPTKWVTRGWITYICDECAHKTRRDGTCEIDYCDPIISNDEGEQNESEAENQ